MDAVRAIAQNWRVPECAANLKREAASAVRTKCARHPPNLATGIHNENDYTQWKRLHKKQPRSRCEGIQKER